jgi:WD40 repeat protein
VELGAESPSELIFIDDGSRLIALTGNDDGVGLDAEVPGGPAGAAMITWRAPELDETQRILLGPDDLIAAQLTPDGNTLVTAGISGTIQVRDPETGELRAEFGTHPAAVRRLAVSPDGRTVATVTTNDSIVRLWSLPRRELVAELRGHDADLNEVVFSADGRRLATGGTDTDVAVWPVEPADAIEQICANLADAGESNFDDLEC